MASRPRIYQMKELKTLTKNQYTLKHTWDDWYFPPTEMMELIIVSDNGSKTHIPFLPPIKATNYDMGRHILEPTDYTDQEYQNILEEKINELRPY